MKRELTQYKIFHYSWCAGERGFSLVELLIAIAIMIIAFGPLMDSITNSIESVQTAKVNTLLVNYAREKMEDVLAMGFPDISVSSPPGTPTALSDTVMLLGNTVNRNVDVEYYDGNGDSTPDPDLKKITVTIEGVKLEALLFEK